MKTEISETEKPSSKEEPKKLWETTEEALEGLKQLRKPTLRGIMLCQEALGKCLASGVKPENLSSWEILYWINHDGEGTHLPNP